MSTINTRIEGFFDRYAAAFLMALSGLVAGAVAFVGA